MFHCIVDHYLTTLVWLKKPMRAPDLPRKRIIADCYAAMNPPPHLWKRYLQEIERLQKKGDISDEDYYLLRYSSEASNALMDTTLGGGQPFTEGTVAEVLESAKAAARADVEAALEDEKVKRLEAEKAGQVSLEKAQREAEGAILEERKAKLDAERRLQIERQAQLDHIRIIGARVGRWVAIGVGAIGLVLLTVATFLGRFMATKTSGASPGV